MIAVLDNNGGRIFDQLPVHQLYREQPALARFWRTAPAYELAHAAQLFGLQYRAPATVTELAHAVHVGLRANATTLLHMRVDPDSARRDRERLLARLADAWDEASP